MLSILIRESRQLHRGAGMLGGQRVHIISFARSLAMVRLRQTNSICPGNVQTRKEKV